MNVLRYALIPMVPAVLGLMPAAAMAAPASCESLATLALPNAKIDSAVSVPAGDLTLAGGRGGRGQTFKDLPAFCRVAATLKPTSDSDIKTEVWLPTTTWNGKFQAMGNGGWGGTISYPAMAEALRNGYATTSTDDGHTGAGGQFIPGHWEKAVDFFWRAVHEMGIQGKAITAAFYGNGPKLSYYNGCSYGGRQGLIEATRFPNDYDGIVAGDPANPRSALQTYQLAVYNQVHKNPAGVLPDDKVSILHKAVLNACDALDGVKDGLIENPKACHFDPQTIVCKSADDKDCLSQAQVDTVKLIMTPAKVNGKVYHPAPMWGSELGWKNFYSGVSEPEDLDNFTTIMFKDNPEWDYKTLTAENGLPAAEKADVEESVTTTDLSKFTAHGGKIIFYHGWADPGVSPQLTIDYYQGVQKTTKNGAESARLFIVPGMGHCRGGEGATDNFDAAAALDSWVTTGKPPVQMVASHMANGKADRTRPLCAYPQVAKYKGSGSTDDAANFACTAP